MRLLLIRHGRTRGNSLGRYIGSTDEPILDSRELRECTIAVDKLFVSPMTRAWQTAAILFPGHEATAKYELREMDFGEFEQRSADDMADDAQYREWVDGGCTGVCPGGESIGGFCERTVKAVREALLHCDSDSTAAIVAHGGTIMAIMSSWTHGECSFFDWFVKNGCGFDCDVIMDGDTPVITRYTEISMAV